MNTARLTLDVASENIGRGVVYRPYPQAQAEDGTITRVSESYVFVHFTGDRAPKATRAEDLEFMS